MRIISNNVCHQSPRRERIFPYRHLAAICTEQKSLLAANLKQNGLALEACNDLVANAQIPADDRIHEYAKAWQAQLDAPGPLGLLAQITDDKWSCKPSRRIFSVDKSGEKLETIAARCVRRNLDLLCLALPCQAGVDWTLPDSLGSLRKGLTYSTS